MYFSNFENTEFIIGEAKRFSEQVGSSFRDICVKTRELFDDTYIIFSDTLNRSEVLFFIFNKNGTAKLLVKKSKWYYFTPKTVDTVKFAEWNAFTDPFEASLAVQKHIYEAVKKYLMNKSEYSSYYEQHEMDRFNRVLDDYEDAEPYDKEDNDYDDKDDRDYEDHVEGAEPEAESYDEPESETVPATGSSLYHTICRGYEMLERSKTLHRLMPPFTEVTEDSYLDKFDETF